MFNPVGILYTRVSSGMSAGEGSFRIGTTGKISALITHELNKTNDIPKVSTSNEKRPQTVPVSVYCGASTKRQQTRRKTPSPRTSTSNGRRRRPTNVEKKLQKDQHGNIVHQVPILGSEDMSTCGSPIIDTSTKMRHRIVEIVDLKCGFSAEKAWPGPITGKFRKLSFSRLSEQ